MRRVLLLTFLTAGFHVSAHAFLEHEVVSTQLEDMRFYSVKTISMEPEGRLGLIAAGQIKQNNREEALIIAFSVTKGDCKEISREVFHIGSLGGSSKTRIRSLVWVKEPSTNGRLIVVNGKTGPENREVGFVRSYLFDNGFKLLDSIEFSDPDTSYTHGYPLILADINGDGNKEIVYGGFSGDNDRDHADIRFFSIGKDGTLSQIKGLYMNRLDALRLRINTLTSGDLDKDGTSEVVAAGRTVENDIEHAAFVAFSDKSLVWKQLQDSGACRYRCATVADINGEGQLELVLGGRVDQGNTSYALLDIWQANKEDMHLISRYRFTGAGSTRLRVVEPLAGFHGRLIIAGRLEALQDGVLKWKGFLQQMTFESGILAPCSRPVILDKDWETRVRTMDIHENYLVAAGFTEDKAKASTAFISVYRLN